MSEETPVQPNGSASLAKLLNQINLPTLALILLTGGGNWFATQNTSQEQKEETQTAIRQIKDLHEALNAFESRQKEMLENQASLLRGQTTTISNQLEVLKKLDQNASKQ